MASFIFLKQSEEKQNKGENELYARAAKPNTYQNSSNP